jgi:very-long-chain (3R)-3-hydroxyacyl-CoA dehydratase
MTDQPSTLFPKIYLSFYNFISFIGWTHLFFIFIHNFLTIGFFETCEIFFFQNKTEILFLQSINLLDILNAFIGLWPSSKVPMYWRIYCKVLRRSLFLPVFLMVPEVHQQYWTGLVIFSWTISDILRYPFYLLNSWKILPNWLKFLRYSNFYYQYPLNIISETKLFILMVPFIHQREIFNVSVNIPFLNSDILIFNYLYLEILIKSYGILKFFGNYRSLDYLFRYKVLGEGFDEKIE